MKMFAKYLEIWVKLPENTGKNGVQRCLILNNWRLTCAELNENFFWRSGRKYSHKELPEFSGRFGEIRAKYFAPPKNLLSPTPMSAAPTSACLRHVPRGCSHSECCV